MSCLVLIFMEHFVGQVLLPRLGVRSTPVVLGPACLACLVGHLHANSRNSQLSFRQHLASGYSYGELPCQPRSVREIVQGDLHPTAYARSPCKTSERPAASDWRATRKQATMSSRQGAAMRRRPTPYDRSVNRTNDNSPAAHSPATRVTRPLSTPQNPGLNRGTPGEPASQASLSFRTGSRRQSAVGSPRLSMRPSGLRAAAVSTPAQAQESDGENNLADSSLQADALNEVIMAIDMNNSGNLGCAYYVAMDEALFLLEDIAMAGNEIVETLLLHVRPTTVLTPARTAQGLLDMLAAGAEGENGASHHRK